MNADYRLIMVPLDGSATAERALPFASAIARRAGSRMELVYVHDEELLVGTAPMVDSAWEDEQTVEIVGAIRAVAERLARETGLGVTAVTLRGPRGRSLVQHAIDRAVDLIVMTTHGRSGFSHAWFGSVAEHVIHAAITPVLVVRAGDHARADVTEPIFRRMLLPIDREHSGVEAMQRALTLGTHGQTTYTLLTVVSALPVLPPPYPGADVIVSDPGFAGRGRDASVLLERIAATARTAGAATEVRVVTHERTAPAILEVADSQFDLIVIPTHPRGSFSRALLGSVVDKVMRGANVPLLLFRASEALDELPASALRQSFAGEAGPDAGLA
ncbi:MAG: universal stress protein [Gemmatimonadota bacterium]|nr:universal stress protein [Gemmatimonadota bacterium]